MGTHGISGFKQWLLGSVTERVLREAPCPVLTPAPRVSQQSPDAASLATVVCAVDFSPSSARALAYAVSMASKAGGRLVLLHALEWFDEEVEAPESGGRHQGVANLGGGCPPTTRRTVDGRCSRLQSRTGRRPSITPAGEVLRVARESDAGLIVLGVHGRNALDRMIFGSTAQRVVREAPCPVLTVRA